MGKTEERIRQTFELARKIGENPDAYPNQFIVLPLDAEILRRVLTEQRLRVLKEIRGEGPFESLKDLAESLGRDETRVGRDLKELLTLRLVSVEKEGKEKRVSAPDVPILLT